MASLSVSIANCRIPLRFEDFPQKGSNKSQTFTSEEFRIIYDLMRDVGDEAQEKVITKLISSPELSKRHFKIIWDSEALIDRRILFPNMYPTFSKSAEIRTFFHLACLYGAEKIVTWFLSQFKGFGDYEHFSLPSESLTAPLPFLIQYGSDHEAAGRITHQLTLIEHYKIKKGCVHTYSSIPNKVERLVLRTEEEINKFKSDNPKVLLTDLVERNGTMVSRHWENVILNACYYGKFNMLNGILNFYFNDRTFINSIIQEISKYSELSPVASIIYEYTSPIYDLLTLSHEVSLEGKIYYHSPLERAVMGLREFLEDIDFNVENVMDDLLKIQTQVRNSRNIEQCIGNIYIAKFFLNLVDNLDEFPAFKEKDLIVSIRSKYEKDFPEGFFDLLKTTDTKALFKNLLQHKLREQTKKQGLGIDSFKS